MTTGYREGEPTIGEVHYAWKSLTDIKNFLRENQGKLDGYKMIYEIKGDLIKDEGRPDGLRIRVKKYKTLYV